MHRATRRNTLAGVQPFDEPVSPSPASAGSSSKTANALQDAETELLADPERHLAGSASDADIICNKRDEGLGRLIVPRTLFVFISTLFWGPFLISYLQHNIQPPSLDDLQALPCNPSKHVLAACAHRGNAAELLQASSSSSSSNGNEVHSLQDQMTVLWSKGITCYDYDVIQLSDGQLVVGHPTQIVQLAQQSHNKGSSASTSVSLAPELLHRLGLSTLRAAGVSAESAPLLHAVMHHFAQLRRSKPISVTSSSSSSSNNGTAGSNTPVQVRKIPLAQAVAERKLQYVPLLSLELKGPAAASIDAWNTVTELATSAGIEDAVLLWLRHQPTATSSSSSGAGFAGTSAVLQLAQGIKTGITTSSSSSSNSTGAGSGMKTGPLIGLTIADNIVKPDVLKSIQHSSSSTTAVRSSSDVAVAAATALIHAAVGLPGAGNSNSSSSTPPAVLESVDVLAPSIRLPAAVLSQLIAWRPTVSWVLDDTEAMQRAEWLGADMGVSNVPVQLSAFTSTGSVCH